MIFVPPRVEKCNWIFWNFPWIIPAEIKIMCLFTSRDGRAADWEEERLIDHHGRNWNTTKTKQFTLWRLLYLFQLEQNLGWFIMTISVCIEDKSDASLSSLSRIPLPQVKMFRLSALLWEWKRLCRALGPRC